MKRKFWLLTTILTFVAGSAWSSNFDDTSLRIYGVLSDTYRGTIFDATGGADRAGLGKWDDSNHLGLSTDRSVFFEGGASLKVTVNGASFANNTYTSQIFVNFTNNGTDSRTNNMIDYIGGASQTGYLSLYLRKQGNVKIRVGYGSSNKPEGSFSTLSSAIASDGATLNADNQWYFSYYALNAFGNGSQVNKPLMVAFEGTGTVWIDNVLWHRVGAPPTASPDNATGFTAVLKNRADNTAAGTQFSFSAQPGVDAWKLANQYIEMDLTYYNPTQNSFIQIYTDNKNASNPVSYTGSGNPAGLLRDPNPTATTPRSTFEQPLAMAWHVDAKLLPQVVTMHQGAGPTDCDNDAKIIGSFEMGDPNRLWVDQLGNVPQCFPSFVWMGDVNTKQTDGSNFVSTPAGANAAIAPDYGRTWQLLRGTQGGENIYVTSPFRHYLYLAANFSYALAKQVYTCPKITLELIHE